MPVQYKVEQGDTLAKIASEHGFADWNAIWDHPNNRELRERRTNPNVLMPRDTVFIPDRVEKAIAASSGQTHRFRAKHSAHKLILVLQDRDSRPLANTRCRLTIDRQSFDLVSDGKGKLEQSLRPTAAAGTLVVLPSEPGVPPASLPLRIGHLDPVQEVSGQSGRLNNLGYFAGPDEASSDEQNANALRSAIEEFQCDHGLKVDGVCGPATQAALTKAHGC